MLVTDWARQLEPALYIFSRSMSMWSYLREITIMSRVTMRSEHGAVIRLEMFFWM